MARLPQLVSALTRVDGRKMGTIEHGSRMLREAGLLVSGKRGVGAPEMGFTDAANLLIAVNATDNLSDGPTATELILALVPTGGVKEDQLFPLPDIERQPTFGDALSWVIAGVPYLLQAIDRAIAGRYCEPYTDEQRRMLQHQARLGMGPANFIVSFERTHARLRIEWTDASPMVDWERRYYLPEEGFDDAAKLMRGDRRVYVEVGLPTLIALYECISGETVNQLEEAGELE